MDLVQDSASAAGLGDAGKRVMEQYELESEIKKREKASAGAGKAAQAKLMETYGGVLSKPYEEFKPSQESLGGFAALGSLLMVAGAMMGGKGRLSGIGAMNNIAGMMKGYQEGRKDLYEQERKQFEENMKTFEKNRGMIKEAFDRALKIAPTNLKLANDMLRRDLQALGASVPAEMVGKSGAVQAAGSYGNFNKNTDQTLQSLKDRLGLSKAMAEAQKADIEAKKAEKALQTPSTVGTLKMYTWKENGEIKRGPLTDAEAIKKRDTQGVSELNIAPTGKAAGDAYGFNEIVTTAANEATASINNMVSMPATVSTGLFGGRQTVNLLTAPLDALTNTLTTEDVQRYNIEVNNFGKFIAQLQKGGRAVTNYDIQNSSAAFAIRVGDTPLTVLTRLAQMRQAAERAIEVRIASPKTDENLKKILRQNEQDIKNAIPFTVNEVNQYALKESGDVPFSDVIKEFMKQSKQPKSQEDDAVSDDWSVEEVQ